MGQMGLKIFQSFVEGASKANAARDGEAPKADE
jgi:hypothetical protein